MNLIYSFEHFHKKKKMTERRRWTANEDSKLVELLKNDYKFLTESLSESKTKRMVDEKWAKITNNINSLGEGRSKLSDEQVQKKWIDIKSKSKTAVMKYKKAMSKTGGGSNNTKDSCNT